MTGHGRPHALHPSRTYKVPRFVGAWRKLACLSVAPVLLILLILPPGTVAAQSPSASIDDLQLQLRIAWGGGDNRQWRGEIRINSGRFLGYTPLGLEADEPGSMVFSPQQIKIEQRSPRIYDGLDLAVIAPRDAVITVRLTPLDDPTAVQVSEVTLASLLDSMHQSPLDSSNNRLLVRRAPGDRLRLHFARESLIFRPGESFAVGATPHHTGAAPRSVVRCNFRLQNSNGTEVWSEATDLTVDETGKIPTAGPMTVPAPVEEGVYSLLVELIVRPNSFATPFRAPKSLAQRRLQFVVLSGDPLPNDTTPWSEQWAFDPAQPDWLRRVESLAAWPQWNVLPGFRKGALGNGKQSVATYNEQKMTMLASQGWQAFPLPVGAVGKPHLLVVEAPADRAQTLAISVVEPNAVGFVGPIGLDSGIVTKGIIETGEDNMIRHKLVFWPRTGTPLVLISNRGGGDALFGKIKLLAGPTRLPTAISAEEPNQRLLSVYLEKPLFPEAMSVSETPDPWTNRTLDDWTMFYQGAVRWVQYLKFAGYNAAVIPVVCDGSGLYPSPILQPTPKYDTGVFFVSGQDPLRKDVFELLLRIFDREGLVLIPAVHFTSPLPELEALRRSSERDGLALVNTSGLTYLETRGARHGLAPYYNPLDPRVQTAMVRVIDELNSRYARHPSFGGISLKMGPQTYTHLPSKDWGYDDRTIDRFEKDLGIIVPGEGENRFAQRSKYLLGAKRKVWLQWRADQIGALHDKMAASLSKYRPGAKLYLAGGDLFRTEAGKELLRPALPQRVTVNDVMLELGLNAPRYADRRNVVLVRPRRIATAETLLETAIDTHLQNSSEVDRYFAMAGGAADLFFHERIAHKQPEFDAVSPFGPSNTQTWILTHAAPGGAENRRRFVNAIAAADPRSLMDGGWMPIFGQEDATRDLFAVYRRLPDRDFDTATSSTMRSQSVVVRSLTDGAQTFLYVVNDSPWPTSVTVQLAAPLGCEIVSLNDRKLESLGRDSEAVIWTIELKPYDLVGARIDVPGIEVNDYTFTNRDTDRIAMTLARRVDSLKSRIGGLGNATPLDTLFNPDFDHKSGDETVPNDGSPEGWTFSKRPGVTVAASSAQAKSGEKSLRLASEGPVAWVRSSPIPTPQTGRISIWVWLKVKDASKQPPLRLAIEGRLEDEVYYKFATVGVGGSAPKINEQWQPYVFHIDDLPSEQLSELRVGFDLMGAGEVFVDDIQVFDIWFYENERDELSKDIAVADFHLSQGNVADCQRLLDGYWAQFLEQNAPMRQAEIASLPDLREDIQTEVETKEESPGMFQRIRSWSPRKLLPF